MFFFFNFILVFRCLNFICLLRPFYLLYTMHKPLCVCLCYKKSNKISDSLYRIKVCSGGTSHKFNTFRKAYVYFCLFVCLFVLFSLFTWGENNFDFNFSKQFQLMLMKTKQYECDDCVSQAVWYCLFVLRQRILFCSLLLLWFIFWIYVCFEIYYSNIPQKKHNKMNMQQSNRKQIIQPIIVCVSTQKEK